jgi:hypothetical protein
MLRVLISGACLSRGHSVRYPMPNYPCEFELPDDWLVAAGFDSFETPTAQCYRSTDDAVPVLLRTIEPPYRLRTVPKDWRGFDRARLIDVLKGIVAGAEIKPVPLIELPAGDFLAPAPYRYRVRDGVHRFYASVAAGFECLPATIVTLAELSALSKSLGATT